jgi:hypothetical protein
VGNNILRMEMVTYRHFQERSEKRDLTEVNGPVDARQT